MKNIKLLLLLLSLFYLSPTTIYSQWELVPGWEEDIQIPLQKLIAQGDTVVTIFGNKILISSDKGNNWNVKGIDNQTIRCFLLNGSVLIAGTDNGIFISYNLGDTWFAKNDGIDTFSIINIIYNEDKIYVASSGGIFYSNNGGNTWINLDVNYGLPFPKLKLVFVSGDTVWVQSTKSEQIGVKFYPYGGSFITFDHGQIWKLRKLNNDSLGYAQINFRNNIIFMLYNKDRQLYTSTDMGETWTINNKINGLYYYNIADDNNILVLKISSVLLSTDNGDNWSLINNPPDYTDYFVMNNGNIWTITNTDEIYLSSDTGKTWEKKYNYIYKGKVLTTAADNGILYVGTTKKLAVSGDQGNTFKFNENGLPNGSIYAIAVKGDNLFVGTATGLFFSSNKGEQWGTKAKDITDTLLKPNIYSIAIDGNNIVAGILGGILLSTDLGNTWDFRNINKNYIIYATAISGQGIFAGSWGGGMFVSTDLGSTWQQKKITDQSIYSVAIKDNYIYSGANNGLFLSTDMGDTWKNTELFFAYGQWAVNYITKILVEGNYIFVTTNRTGVFVSTDNGETFEARNTGLNLINCDKHSLIVNGDYIYYSQYDVPDYIHPTFYRANLENLIKLDVRENISSLNNINIFPNPARDYIYINSTFFDDSGMWEYQIYNILGNCVQNGVIESNKINISRLSSGFYTVRFFSGSKQVVEKMMKE